MSHHGYYCYKCGRMHRYSSNIGMKHLKYNPYFKPKVKTLAEVYAEMGFIPKSKVKVAEKFFRELEELKLINPRLIYTNPGVKELADIIAKKLVKQMKPGAPYAVKTAKRIGTAIKISVNELAKAFTKIREKRLTKRQIKELAEVINILWEGGIIDLPFSPDPRKRKHQMALLVKYGLLEPELFKEKLKKILEVG